MANGTKLSRRISQKFKETHAGVGEPESPPTGPLAREALNMSLADILSIWHRNTPAIGLGSEIPPKDSENLPDNSEIPPEPTSAPVNPDSGDFSDGDSTEISFDDEGVQIDATGFQQYRDCLASSATYKWLLETLKKQVLLTAAVPDVRGEIRRQILSSLPRSQNKVSRKAPSEAYTTLFRMEWDPASFVKEQKYNASPDVAIASAITITGSAQDAQALTSDQYLQQTWDSLAVLRIVQEVLRRSPGEECSGKSPTNPIFMARVLVD